MKYSILSLVVVGLLAACGNKSNSANSSANPSIIGVWTTCSIIELVSIPVKDGKPLKEEKAMGSELYTLTINEDGSQVHKSERFTDDKCEKAVGTPPVENYGNYKVENNKITFSFKNTKTGGVEMDVTAGFKQPITFNYSVTNETLTFIHTNQAIGVLEVTLTRKK